MSAPANQTWIPPGAPWPTCPVCKTVGDVPNTPVLVAEPDGSFTGATFANARQFICRKCGVFYAWFTT